MGDSTIDSTIDSSSSSSSSSIDITSSNDKKDIKKIAILITKESSPPLDALKRFSDDNASNQKGFYDLNRKRVADFIDKPLEFRADSLDDLLRPKPIQNKGIYEYLGPQEFKSLILLQDYPEFSKQLGDKSRFGEGDGSFFDKFLTSGTLEPTKREKAVDILQKEYKLEDNVVITTKSHSGFKQLRETMDKKVKPKPGEKEDMSTVLTYSQRKQRIQDAQNRHNNIADDLSKGKFDGVHMYDAVKGSDDDVFSISTEGSPETAKLPVLVSEKNTYFGRKSHLAFYDFYKKMSRHKNYLCANDGDSLNTLLHHTNALSESPEAVKSVRKNLSHTIANRYSPTSVNDTTRSLPLLATDDGEYTTRSSASNRDNDTQEIEESNIENDITSIQDMNNEDGDAMSDITYNDHQMNTATKELSIATHEDMSSPSREALNNLKKKALEAELEVQSLHLAMPHIVEETNNDDGSTTSRSISFRPASARSKFIANCVVNGIAPKPSLLIRKGINSTLDVSNQAMGDELGKIFAESLDGMPYLEDLNVANNKLKDPGLEAIILALSRCHSLKSLNLSDNKIDTRASAALAKYLGSPACNLIRMILKSADVDDNEVDLFADAINHRKTIRFLDLSHNLLGSHELQCQSDEAQVTGGAVIGKLIQKPDCAVTTIILSWNMIRLSGAKALARSLKLNNSITHLDLSYNSLGLEAGEILGDVLHTHKTLTYLNISNNNIKPRACFTILSGLRTSESLKEIDISSNLLGMAGARSLTAMNFSPESSVIEKNVIINGCTFKIHNDDCWFDITKVLQDYELDLSVPYERAIYADLFRFVAYNDDVNISIVSYDDGGSKQDLEFEMRKVPIHNEFVKVDDKTLTILNISHDISKTLEIFREVKRTSNDNVVTKKEMKLIFEKIEGKNSSQYKLIDQIFAFYNLDSSPFIEEFEFVEYLLKAKEELNNAKKWASEMRYLVLKGKKERYIPPDHGIVKFKCENSNSRLSKSYTVTQRNLDDVLDIMKGVAESGAILESALGLIRLNFSEARQLYRIMLKEIGDKMNVLINLLPRIVDPADARHLLNITFSGSATEKNKIKKSFRDYYYVAQNIPNGHYSLLVGEKVDRLCLDSLITISDYCAAKRSSLKLGDTSQHGNWQGFRNAVFEGKAIVLDKEWIAKIPLQGKLEFDFVVSADITTVCNSTPISNKRFFHLIKELGLVDENHWEFVESKLKVLSSESNAVLEERKRPIPVMKADACSDMMQHLQVLYDNVTNRTIIDMKDIEKEEAWLLDPKQPRVNPPKTPVSGVNEESADSAKKEKERKKSVADETPLTKKKSAANFFGQTLATKAAQEFEMKPIEPPNFSAGEYIPVKYFGPYLSEIRSKSDVTTNLLAAKILEACLEIFSGICVTCSQLSIILNQFPRGTAEATNYSTFRVELVIRLFTQIIDKVNFDIILRLLSPKEIAMIIFRLGWLNIFSPLKFQGAVAVNLSRRDDRQLGKILIFLSHMESREPKKLQISANYQLDSKAKIEASEWQLPQEWHKEDSLSSTGIYSLLIDSEKGIASNIPTESNDTRSSISIEFTKTDTFSDIEEQQFDDFEGDLATRYALQACVLPLYEKVKGDNTTTISTLEELMLSNDFNFTL